MRLPRKLALALLCVTVGCIQADYSDNESAIELIDGLVADLDFDREALESVLADAQHMPKIIELMEKPAESISWHQYREIFIHPERIEAGVEFIEEYEEDLKRAQETYQVPPHIISAIIGVETYYGRYLGDHRVIDALATLGFDYPRRADFFREELRHFLILACEERIKPFDQEDSCHRMSDGVASGNERSIEDLKGSYAGAMGYGQFIPSSYRNFAIDFDGDGMRDIWTNKVDAIGSVASYFAEHNWIPDGDILELVTIDSEAEGLIELANQPLAVPTTTVAEWRELGIRSESPETHTASLFAYSLNDEGTPVSEEYILAFDNFYVITRYNRSRLYARVVYELATDIQESMK